MLRIALLVLVAGLAGCANPNAFGRAMEYNSAKITRVRMPDDTYRVFDHPKEQKIMTTSSVGTAAAAGAARSATFGLGDPFAPEQRHEAAARKYLNDTGRTRCTITSGYLLMQPQYEFTYECPEPTG